ncbi:MAG TPA: S8 family serine peptidase [Vicinamibacterales bacterium]|nr:S8 family serine peptidase [Vicinamibacterales bacterium]
MTGHVLSLDRLAGRTGRGVRVAVIDSGVHVGHPHVGAVAGGAGFGDDGRQTPDYADRLGHGTAVAAAIREKAPDVSLLAARVFERALSTSGLALVEAIRWAVAERADLINLSLGTANPEHELSLSAMVAHARAHGALIVAAAPADGVRWLPGALDGVIGVEVDWGCPRDRCVVSIGSGFRPRVSASGLPRPIPGVPPERNLRGQSFAVANATGFVALFVEGRGVRTVAEFEVLLGSLAV